MTNNLIIEFVGFSFLLLVIILAVVYFRLQSKPKQQWIEEVKVMKKDLLTKLKQDNIDIKKSVLIDMDKLLDHVFKKRSLRGETMGERLKTAKGMYDRNTYNEIWQAHKLRNTLVHEINFQVKAKEIEKNCYILGNAIDKII